jgi:SAM-dependent methyltransferase
MQKRLITNKVKCASEIRLFFDEIATSYSEQHGDPEALLEYRVALIQNAARFRPDDVVLDVGCGNGHHLFALVDQVGKGIGIDFSREMIRLANKRLSRLNGNSNLTFRVDNGETLGTIDDQSVDVCFCIGAFEHILHKEAVLRQVNRVLRKDGRFILLTPNGSYVWYRLLAPLLRLQIRHFSTDEFLNKKQIRKQTSEAGFREISIDYWTFIPKGDMPRSAAWFLDKLDKIGSLFHLNQFRGGIMVTAEK